MNKKNGIGLALIVLITIIAYAIYKYRREVKIRKIENSDTNLPSFIEGEYIGEKKHVSTKNGVVFYLNKNDSIKGELENDIVRVGRINHENIPGNDKIDVNLVYIKNIRTS